MPRKSRTANAAGSRKGSSSSRKRRSRKKKIPRGVYSRRRSSYDKARCNPLLAEKIRENIREYKKGRYVSRNQAIAVSFQMIAKSHPKCRRFQKRR